MSIYTQYIKGYNAKVIYYGTDRSISESTYDRTKSTKNIGGGGASVCRPMDIDQNSKNGITDPKMREKKDQKDLSGEVS